MHPPSGNAPLAAVGLAAVGLLSSSTALAQGVPDARTGVTLPDAQSAAADTALAPLVNPAGLAFVEGIELSLGGFLRGDGVQGQSDLDLAFAISAAEGFAFGFGTGLSFPDAATPRLRTTGAFGVGAHSLSAGIAVHTVGAIGTGASPDFLVDVGLQTRPARWLAFGAGLEGLGDQDLGPTSLRAGVSFRPLEETLTVGLDARVVPGSTNIASDVWLANAQVLPGLVARVDLGGVAILAGATMKNLGAVVPGPPEVEIAAGIEVNGEHLGAVAFGGVDGLGANVLGGLGGTRVRTSSAAWQPLFPPSGRWLSFALTADGVPVEDKERGLIDSLLADEPEPLAVMAALHNAAKDPSIEGVLVRVRGLTLGWGRLTELRGAFKKLKDAGKKVVMHLDSGDDTDVYLASVADKVYLTPSGSLQLDGLRAELTYLADALDKIGLRAEEVRAGKYKTAPRMFTASEPSPEELEVGNALLDAIYGALVDAIAAGRGLDKEQVKAIIDRGGLTAAEALQARIVDELLYEDELKDKIKEVAGHAVFLEEHALERRERSVRWDATPHIAVIPVVGAIAMSGGGLDLFGRSTGAKDTIEAIENAVRDEDVVAIVLRIDSPGGDALAADLIWRALVKARERKPIIASLGDVAASGGYYVAAAAHYIFAEPTTITGSIGVFGLFIHGEKLADDWGVKSYPLERGAAPGPTLLRPMSEAERKAMQAQVDATYQRFLDAVALGRGESGPPREVLAEIAQGRAWTGAEAKERKLVDGLGSILDALDEARRRAGLGDDDDVVLDVITGREDNLARLAGLAQVLGLGAERKALALAAKFLLGDPAALALVAQSDKKPLALQPYTLRVR